MYRYFVISSYRYKIMRALIQRVSRAKVTVENQTVGEIDKGILVFLGITHDDSEKDVDYLVEKICNLRIFPNEKSHFDKSAQEVNGSLLVVSQFTLYGDMKKGRRPDFTSAAKPELAEALYALFIKKAHNMGLNVASGEFGAMMHVELVNDGPVTFMIDSKNF